MRFLIAVKRCTGEDRFRNEDIKELREREN